MANPTVPHTSTQRDFDDLYTETEGVIVNGVVVISDQQALVADAAAVTAIPVVVTFTANTPTPADTQTIADGTVPTVAELGQWVANSEEFMAQAAADLAELRTQLNAALDVLESHGLMADA